MGIGERDWSRALSILSPACLHVAGLVSWHERLDVHLGRLNAVHLAELLDKRSEVRLVEPEGPNVLGPDTAAEEDLCLGIGRHAGLELAIASEESVRSSVYE